VEHRGRDGDPRFLAQYASAVVERAKMLGAYGDDDGRYTLEQFMAFVQATVRALEQVGADGALVERFKRRTLALMGDGGTIGRSAVVGGPASEGGPTNVSADAEPPATSEDEEV
jgi:hypothetical protein